jgi:hypothetical protein
LGKEELQLHKNRSNGPLYYLNRHLVGELASFDNLELKKKYLNQICHSKDFSPSVTFLKLLLIQREDIFIIRGDLKSSKNALLKGTIDLLLSRAPHLFFRYLGHLKTLTPHAGCLERAIPQLPVILERYRYLEQDYGHKQLIADHRNLEGIFDKLKNLDDIVRTCIHHHGLQGDNKKSK